MSTQLAPLDQLIRLRQNRLNFLVDTLNQRHVDRVPAEQLYRSLVESSESYRSRGWELFVTDLDLLADHDCLWIAGGDVVVRSTVEYSHAAPGA